VFLAAILLRPVGHQKHENAPEEMKGEIARRLAAFRVAAPAFLIAADVPARHFQADASA
jgi:hypothetical protein